MGEKLLGKLQAAQMGERRGQWRPAEHRRARLWNLPPRAAEAFDQHVASALVELAVLLDDILRPVDRGHRCGLDRRRSEEHTSELQSLMRISYAVFCLKKKRKKHNLSIDNSQRHTTTVPTQPT